MKAKPKKEEVFKINATFDELVGMSVQGNPAPKPKKASPKKKK